MVPDERKAVMYTSQRGNPDKHRFRFIHHPAEKALPGMPSTRRPAWWEVVDRVAYAGEAGATDTLGFVREGFGTKADAIVYAKARIACNAEPVSVSLLTLH